MLLHGYCQRSLSSSQWSVRRCATVPGTRAVSTVAGGLVVVVAGAAVAVIEEGAAAVSDPSKLQPGAASDVVRANRRATAARATVSTPGSSPMPGCSHRRSSRRRRWRAGTKPCSSRGPCLSRCRRHRHRIGVDQAEAVAVAASAGEKAHRADGADGRASNRLGGLLRWCRRSQRQRLAQRVQLKAVMMNAGARRWAWAKIHSVAAGVRTDLSSLG